jgi:hypothetical protein
MNYIFKNPAFPLQTNQQDIDYLFEMVRKSPYVAQNPDYTEKANDTKITYDHDELVNAYAQTFAKRNHGITMLQGLCNMSKLLGVALAYFNQNPNKKTAVGRLSMACRWIGNEIIDDDGDCSLALVRKGLTELSYDTDGMIGIDAKSYAAGGMLSVIGHEMGHICLSHTRQRSRSEEVSRNNERQADLFGCNVTVTSPFASHTVLANLFFEVLITWLMGNEKIATTHPHSRERVFNAINAHNEILDAMGINAETIEYFLPHFDENGVEENDTTETTTEPDIVIEGEPVEI